MKKLIVIAGCFIITCILLIVLFNPISNKNTENAADNHKNEIKSDISYIVGEYQGNVAIFEENNTSPFRITNVSINDLPASDRELLQKGIHALGQEELNSIIEDYCS